jgi:hypothetical protein
MRCTNSGWVVMLATVALAIGFAPVASADQVPGHGRAWELVTPPDPNASFVLSMRGSNATGDRIAYVTLGPPPGSLAGSIFAHSSAVRGPSGWESKPVGYPYSIEEGALISAFPAVANEDLTTWVWTSTRPLLPEGPSSPDSGLYKGGTDGSLALLGNIGSGGDPSSPQPWAVSADAEHVVFETEDVLLPADASRTGGRGVYEYAGSELRLVSVDEIGQPLSDCGSIVGSHALPPNPISRDGRRIFVTSPRESCGTAPPRTYLRQNGSTTVEVSASRCTRADCNAAEAAILLGATPTGSQAVFSTTQQLTNDDVDASSDLYRYDVAGDVLTRVSRGAPGTEADVIPTAVRISGDGSRVYFLARGALLPGQGVTGEPNLYLADDGGLRFVATLAPGGWEAGLVGIPERETVDMTRDGRVLLFVTRAALTDDDEDTAQDVYLYDADDETLRRVSGAPGNGNGEFPADAARSFAVPLFVAESHGALSADGRRAFFTTSEALLPEDVNDALDVYEWADGTIGLVSSGTGNDQLVYAGASDDGSTVFFATDASLVPDDLDGGDHDLYAARIGGGFPRRPAAPQGCAGAACRAPSGRMSRPTPSSISQAGARGGGLELRRVGPAARRRLAATGRIALVVRTPTGGRVSARATARIRGRTRTIARSSVVVTSAGRARLPLRLSRPARRRLEAGRALRVRLALRHSRLADGLTITLKLGGAS